MAMPPVIALVDVALILDFLFRGFNLTFVDRQSNVKTAKIGSLENSGQIARCLCTIMSAQINYIV